MSSENEERETVLVPPTSPKPDVPSRPPGTRAAIQANPGFVVVFGEQHPRVARFPDYEECLHQAERQRAGLELFAVYNGRDYGTQLREGASPLLSVAAGQTIEQARKQARPI